MNAVRQTRLYHVLGENIKKYRLQSGLSQTGLASKVNLSRTSVVNIEQGRQHPSLHLVWQIAESLQISIYDLIPDKIETKSNQTLDVQMVKEEVNEEAFQRVSSFIARKVQNKKGMGKP